QPDRDLDGGVLLLRRRLLGQLRGLQRRVEPFAVDLLGGFAICLAVLAHSYLLFRVVVSRGPKLALPPVETYSTVMPIDRAVPALDALRSSMMLAPCWLSAGPTGGAGLACPAWICSLISPATFFFFGAMLFPFSVISA